MPVITIGIGAGFLLGLIILVIHLTLINSRYWHERYHRNRWELMCDRCLRERGYL